MGGYFKVIYYEEISGRIPVKEFLEDPATINAEIMYSAITFLQENGPLIQSTKMDKRINKFLRELRKGNLRVLYSNIKNTNYILLLGFVKDERKTPPEHIAKAMERLKDYQTRMEKTK